MTNDDAYKPALCKHGWTVEDEPCPECEEGNTYNAGWEACEKFLKDKWGQLRQKAYADSPFDLATTKDDAYRDGVDYVLDRVLELPEPWTPSGKRIGRDKICIGCDKKMSIYPALSRYGHGNICSDCGVMEAMLGDFIGKGMAFCECGKKKAPHGKCECEEQQ